MVDSDIRLQLESLEIRDRWNRADWMPKAADSSIDFPKLQELAYPVHIISNRTESHDYSTQAVSMDALKRTLHNAHELIWLELVGDLCGMWIPVGNHCLVGFILLTSLGSMDP